MYKVLGIKYSSGFTLIELLVVIAILGILTTSFIVLINPPAQFAKTRDAQRKSDLRQIQSALEFFRADNGCYPDRGCSPQLANGFSCGSVMVAAGVTYMAKILCDPLNTGQYVYTYSFDGTTYSLISCLENTNDAQKDPVNNALYCAGGTTNWSYTLKNP